MISGDEKYSSFHNRVGENSTEWLNESVAEL